MADYISKNEVLNLIMHNDKVCHYADERYENVVYATACRISDVVANMPAADVKQVKYSSWEYRTYPIVDRDGVARRCMRGYVCKACGHGEPEEKRFCGGCGAEMRGDDNG